MSAKTFFIAWQATRNRGWFPVGRLDVDVKGSGYRFRYVKGAVRAQEEVDFSTLMEFPKLKGNYESEELFPTFTNRVMSKSRPDFAEYMRNLDLHEGIDPIESMNVDGGYRVTDAYEVFPKIEKGADGSFRCRFFLHGDRHTNPDVEERINDLKSNENLYVGLQLNNPATNLAVQIQTEDYYMIGWSPRYLARDLAAAMIETTLMEEPNTDYRAHVVRVNPRPTPSSHRVLIEFRGYWDKYEPMSGSDFQPLVS